MKDRKLLMIPGPIEFTPEVLRAMGMSTASHVAPNFIEVFGQALERMREVWLCPAGQPFATARPEQVPLRAWRQARYRARTLSIGARNCRSLCAPGWFCHASLSLPARCHLR